MVPSFRKKHLRLRTLRDTQMNYYFPKRWDCQDIISKLHQLPVETKTPNCLRAQLANPRIAKKWPIFNHNLYMGQFLIGPPFFHGPSPTHFVHPLQDDQQPKKYKKNQQKTPSIQVPPMIQVTARITIRQLGHLGRPTLLRLAARVRSQHC